MFKALLAPTGPSTPLSTYITINGVIYMSTGFLFWLYPYALELFGSPKLTDDVAGYARGIGIAVIQIGWFYLWGARTRSRVFCVVHHCQPLFRAGADSPVGVHETVGACAGHPVCDHRPGACHRLLHCLETQRQRMRKP